MKDSACATIGRIPMIIYSYPRTSPLISTFQRPSCLGFRTRVAPVVAHRSGALCGAEKLCSCEHPVRSLAIMLAISIIWINNQENAVGR